MPHITNTMHRQCQFQRPRKSRKISNLRAQTATNQQPIRKDLQTTNQVGDMRSQKRILLSFSLSRRGRLRNFGSRFFPSPIGRGFKERDLIQRAFLARDSRFCFCSESAQRLCKGLRRERIKGEGPYPARIFARDSRFFLVASQCHSSEGRRP